MIRCLSVRRGRLSPAARPRSRADRGARRRHPERRVTRQRSARLVVDLDETEDGPSAATLYHALGMRSALALAWMAYISLQRFCRFSSAAGADDDTAPSTKPPHPIVLVTGPSGAGRSTAINALEDLGYEVIDNLPLSLLPRLLDGPRRAVRWPWALMCATAISVRMRWSPRLTH